METQLKDLIKLQAKFPGGLRFSKQSIKIVPITANRLFDSVDYIPSSVQGLPTPAFLVPTVLDTLSASFYAPIVSVVPAEADVFCAQAAFETGCTILTGDSDLLVYDLGKHGNVVFFDQIELRVAKSPYHCPIINVLTNQPSDIARRLGLEDFKRLAYQIKKDPSISLLEAVKRARPSMNVRNLIQTSSTDEIQNDLSAFLSFCKEYDTEAASIAVLKNILMASRENSLDKRFLDPRLSELTLTISNPPQVYPAFLFEDPSRTSAWSVSGQIRILAYSCLFSNTHPPLDRVSEFHRRGQRINVEEVRLLSHDGIVARVTKIVYNFEKFRTFFYDIPEPLFWRMYALHEIHYWTYINYESFPPAKMTRYALADSASNTVCWMALHLSAQVQATLGSIRMLKQILDHMRAVAKISESAGVSQALKRLICPQLSKLENILKKFPPIHQLMPSRAELEAQVLSSAKARDLLYRLFSILEVTLEKDLASYKKFYKREEDEVEEKIHPYPNDHKFPIKMPAHKHKRKKSHSKETLPTGDLHKQHANIYSVLHSD